jgi:hypothetical protein
MRERPMIRIWEIRCLYIYAPEGASPYLFGRARSWQSWRLYRVTIVTPFLHLVSRLKLLVASFINAHIFSGNTLLAGPSDSLK